VDNAWKKEEEQAVRSEVAELVKSRLLSEQFVSGGIPAISSMAPVTCSLELGLRCLIMQDNYGTILTDEERKRLVARVNVMLRAHPPMGMPLQVSEIRGVSTPA
jgi:hypothetical protein